MKTFVLKIGLKQTYNRSCTAHAPRPCRPLRAGWHTAPERTAPCSLSCAQQARLRCTRQTARLNGHAARQHYKVTAGRPLLYQPRTCRPNARQRCRPPLCNPHCPGGQPYRSCPNGPARKSGLTGQGKAKGPAGRLCRPCCSACCHAVEGAAAVTGAVAMTARHSGCAIRCPAPAVQAYAQADAQADEPQASPHSWTVLAP